MGIPLCPTSADVVYHVLNRAGRCSTMTATTPRLNECCGKQWFLTPFPVPHKTRTLCWRKTATYLCMGLTDSVEGRAGTGRTGSARGQGWADPQPVPPWEGRQLCCERRC